MPYPPNKCIHFAAVSVCRLAIVEDLLGSKRSQTSYNQPGKPVIHGVLKVESQIEW